MEIAEKLPQAGGLIIPRMRWEEKNGSAWSERHVFTDTRWPGAVVRNIRPGTDQRNFNAKSKGLKSRSARVTDVRVVAGSTVLVAKDGFSCRFAHAFNRHSSLQVTAVFNLANFSTFLSDF
jgi:hypothetical protein